MPAKLLSMQLIGTQHFPGGRLALAGYKNVFVQKENGEIQKLLYSEQDSPQAIVEDLKRTGVDCVDFERAWSAGGK